MLLWTLHLQDQPDGGNAMKPGPRKRKRRALEGARAALRARFEREVPPRGTCFLCGDEHDARHRLVDAIRARSRCGDSDEELALDYAMPLKTVRLVLETSFQ